MSKGSKVALGFVAAAVVGGGGGYALGPIADTMAARMPRPELPAKLGSRQVQIEEARGDVQLLAPDGGWVPARPGDTVARPTCVETSGVLSTFRATLGSSKLSIGHDARVVIGENDAALQLDRGHVTLSGARVTTYVPLQRMKISGTNYGVWAREKRVVVAVLEGEVEVTRGDDTAKYAAGREIVYQGRTVTPRGLEPQLTVQITDEQQRQNDRRVQGMTSPAAFVFRKTESGYDPVSVSSAGKFTVTLPREPSPGEVVVFDAAGRTAHLGGAPEAAQIEKLAPKPEPKAEIEPEPVVQAVQAERPDKPEKKKKANGKKKSAKPRAVEPGEPSEPADRPTELENAERPPPEETQRKERTEDGDPPTLMPIED